MGGKKGILSAKEKEAAKAKEQASKAAAAKEDSEWDAAGEGKKTKAQAKRSIKDGDRQVLQAKKLEARRMAEEEADTLASAEKKGKPLKVTRFELDQQKEREKREAAAKAQQTMNSRELREDQYNQLVDGEVNVVDGVDAHNVDEAVAQLTVTEVPKMKFSQYLEREMVQLKREKPGLKVPQYKDIIWKKWIRSSENPLNQKVKD